MEFDHQGRRIRVRKNADHEHPSDYMYCWIDEAGPLFLGVHRPGMTRGNVKQLVEELLDRRRQAAMKGS